VNHLVDTIRGMAGSSAYLNEVSQQLDAQLQSGDFAGLSKQALYASHAMNTRVVSKTEDVQVWQEDRFKKSDQGKASGHQPKA